jgi:hypothetical protein
VIKRVFELIAMRVSIQTTMTNHRQEIETNYRQETETNNRQDIDLHKPREKRKNLLKRSVGISGVPRTTRIKFKSVLTKPFSLWNEIEDIIGEFFMYLSNSQRKNVAKNLIQFLELKIIMEDYNTSGLLSPSEVVAHVWHILILETELYRDVVYSIQDFHARPHRFVHHALFRKYSGKEYHERLERTQRLFKSYYGVEMPTALRMESDNLGKHIATDFPTSVRIDAASLLSESIDDVTFDNKRALSVWYTPWLRNFFCFGAFENGLCGKEKRYEDIYSHEENMSLLTTPHGLQDE